MGYLAKKYGIHHIKISPYNSQANGVVKRKHFDVRESLMKACNNDKTKWIAMAPTVFWADRVTIRWSTGYSPYFIAHGVEAVLPFNIVEATYLLPPLEIPMSTESLIARHAQQLLKCLEDLRTMTDMVLKGHKLLAMQFVSKFASTIQDHDFRWDPSFLSEILILRRNSTEIPRPVSWAPW